jgi:hypothetical protein
MLENMENDIEKYFGSVEPRKKPEDLQRLREGFEQGVAQEVMRED